MKNMFSNTDKEITLIYYSEDHVGRQILSYAQEEGFPIRDIDLKYTTLTATHWAGIAQSIGIPPKELINVNDPDFMRKFKGISDMKEEDWLKILVHNPDVLKAPIVMKGEKVVQMSNPQDMIHFVKK